MVLSHKLLLVYPEYRCSLKSWPNSNFYKDKKKLNIGRQLNETSTNAMYIHTYKHTLLQLPKRFFSYKATNQLK